MEENITIEEIKKEENLVFKKTELLTDKALSYCPGCGHSIIHRLVAEIIEDLDIGGRVIGVPPAGCAVLAYNYFDVDMAEAAHGRGSPPSRTPSPTPTGRCPRNPARPETTLD